MANSKKTAHRHEKGKCKDILGKMSDYMEKELDSTTYSRLEKHFANCPPCMMVLRTLKKTIQVFRQKKKPAMPKDTSREMHDYFRNEIFKGKNNE